MSGAELPGGVAPVDPPAETVVDLLTRSRSQILCGDETTPTESLDAATLLDRGRRLADALAASGLQPGDRIAVQLRNTVTYLDLLAAAAVGRFVIMSVNHRFAPALTNDLISRSGARLVVRGPDDLPAPAPAADHAAAAPTDRFMIFTTSGTTRAPKLVAHTQQSIAHHACEIAHVTGAQPETVAMVALPLCGTFGLTSLMAALAGHQTIVMPSTFDAAQVAALIARHRPVAMHGSDDMFWRLLDEDAPLSTLELSGYGRFNTSLDGVVERASAAGLQLRGLYGMSEVQALFSYRRDNEPSDRRWLAGGELTSPTARYRVVDDELQLRGPSLFEGYLADGGAEIDRALTDEHIDDGWFRTGDLAEAESARSFRFVTRMGDVLRLGGFLVAPAEIESVLVELPGVDAAQVVTVDGPSGARPVAFVVRDDAAGGALTEAQIIAACRERLATFKCPVKVLDLDAFPVTDGPNGVKIQRARLRAMAADVGIDTT